MRFASFRRVGCVVWTGCALWLAAPAGAGETAPATAPAEAKPSAAAGAGRLASLEQKARNDFEGFAREWMTKIRSAAAAARSGTTRTDPGLRYNRYPDQFTTELRPTSSTAAPFVGLLRYVEEQMACKDTAVESCEIESATRVTEIFRYQGGKWIY